ncbi:DUF4832 domain-containing protein [Chitinophaga eiseniae]|uniref:DUF4832 domain-containing protein n=1 Tax=Chitinophaga eiseniae TaxID=634771 RepID=A0A847SPP3_9BACT|nr:DUF4832 domain-containing protein [Chitinophaga eiseniae]NLR79858.1 DUF4832 domain-containing protein [Chitinophaga eiseniae]
MKSAHLVKMILLWVVMPGNTAFAQMIDFAKQGIVRVTPKEIDSVLNNPGIGFTTFQRFNGDTLNTGLGWTEGKPIDYQRFNGSLANKDYPATTIAYFRVYWRFLEPEKGKYNWALIDQALKTAHDRGQTLMIRVAPYGEGDSKGNDVPDWYRTLVGKRNEWIEDGGTGWRVDPEDSRYAQYFGGLIAAMGQHYDGHPDVEAVDLSVVGFWGEGRGASLLSQKTRAALVDAYTDHFRKTPLIALLTDKKTNEYALSKAPIGWRIDCLGDMGGFDKNWSHMYDYYPEGIINFGMRDAWKKGPVSLEVCWVIQKWKDEGWDINYIIDQSLKWHISSFNAKSSAVPKEWWPAVNRWLNSMGYRFALRKFTYPREISRGANLTFTSWWENKGVAPVYRKDFSLAIRLTNGSHTVVRTTDADICSWLPGDNLYDSAIQLPFEMPAGDYQLDIGITDRQTNEPRVNLAIEGRTADGWYRLGRITVQ